MTRAPVDLRDRLNLVKAVVCLGFLASFLIAARLFLHHPLFTPIPVLPGLPALPPPVDLVVLVTLGVLLLPILFLRRPWKLVLVWCALFAARTVWDESTWQPYFYQYFFLLLSLVFAGQREGDPEDAAVLDSSRLLMASTYFWAGLNKFNYTFFHLGLANISPRLVSSIPAGYVPWVGLVMAGTETALGIGLLFRRSRRIAMLGAIAMHAVILAGIGPWGRDYNHIVWPWNAAIILLLVVLFRERAAPGVRWSLSLRGWAGRTIVLVFFVLGPAASFLGLWPAYFSLKLYSGNIHWGSIYVTRQMADTLPLSTRNALVPTVVKPFSGYLEVLPWSERELGTSVPPEPPIFKEIARRLCRLAPGPRDVLLLVEDPPDVWTGVTRRTPFGCADLGVGARPPGPR